MWKKEKKAVTGQMGKVTDDGSEFTVALNVLKFRPDELKVNIKGRTLTVEGRQEVEEEWSRTCRSFLRQWTLPEGVGAEQIGSSLTDEGQLAISYQSTKRPSALGVSLSQRQLLSPETSSTALSILPCPWRSLCFTDILSLPHLLLFYVLTL